MSWAAHGSISSAFSCYDYRETYSVYFKHTDTHGYYTQYNVLVQLSKDLNL